MSEKIQNHLIIIIALLIANIGYAQSDLDEFFTPSSKVGGYGELHYNQIEYQDNSTDKTLDFHRFVLFYSYHFNENFSFNAEVELEHNLVKDGQGELELEQAYVNYVQSKYFGVRAGVVLNSVGLINETHEPPTFLGVERPEYSKYIVPTTWFGNGGAIFGGFENFNYTVTVMEGLNSDKLSASNIKKEGIRKGRVKGFKANAKSILLNGKINYTGIRGLLIGASYTHNNAIGDSTSNKIGLFEAHARYKANNIFASAEFGNISYSEGEVETSMGYYIDLGYNIGSFFNTEFEIYPFVRYTEYNTASKTLTGEDSEKENKVSKIMGGISILPVPQVVIKFDYARRLSGVDEVQTNMFNVGVGYMF